MVLGGIRELTKSKPLSSETLAELGKMLLDQGLTTEQIRKALATPRVQAAITQMGQQASTATRAGAGIAAPIIGNQ